MGDPIHGPPADDEPLGKQISRMLFELGGRMRAHLEDVATAVDLSPMQARALHHLGQPCPMGDVADVLGCDASNVTSIVDRLEARGLVERQPDRVDRRRKLLVTTPAGEDTRREMHTRMVTGHPILKGLTVEQQRTLRDLLATALSADEPAGHQTSAHEPAAHDAPA